MPSAPCGRRIMPMPTPNRRPRRISLRSGVTIAVVIGVVAGVISGGSGSGPKLPTNVGPAVAAVDPSRFAKGSCMALAPTHGDRHLTVFLDAGHGGRDPGGLGETQSGKSISDAGGAL